MEAKNTTLLLAIGAFIAVSMSSFAGASDAIGSTPDGSFTPPSNQAGSSGYIALKHQKQETNLCVPTSASIVLNFYGTPIPPREIKTLSSTRRQRPNKEFDDFTATMFLDLLSGLRKVGVDWRQQTYRNNKYGFRDGLKDITASIDAGNPVLVDTDLYGGHTFVVSGYDAEAQTIIVVDPNLPEPGLRILPYDKFEDVWNSRGVGFNGRGAVFTSPKR